MGLLDDAIREHLELKRRRGADPTEMERLEREALGPVRRAPDEGNGMALDEPREDGFFEEPEAPERSEVHEFEPEEAFPGEHDYLEEPEAEAPAAGSESMLFDHEADSGASLDADLPTPPPPASAASPAPPGPEPTMPAPASDFEALNEETAEYDVEAEHAAEGKTRPRRQPGGKDEDVLEETPEFLQDTPEHDRLWFEQRPPRDFEFDE